MGQPSGECYLLVASSRAPQLTLLDTAVKPNVLVFSYSYENATLDDILVGIHRKLQGRKVDGVCFLLHSLETEMLLCFAESRVLNDRSVLNDPAVRSFFHHLVQHHLTNLSLKKRLDFFNSCVSPQCADFVAQQLRALLKLPVGIWKDFQGGDKKIGELYFNLSNLRITLVSEQATDEKLTGYEKIRAVGKGAFGTAVLYKNVKTDTLVVIKEINMVELTATERQMALNEAQVLSLLNHPNIVSYYRSFECDGVLMIEMEYADGGNLAQFLTRQTRALPERDVIAMFQQIVAAIQHMHQHNILHRDLKTANVFLTKENSIKVGDFGISKAMTTKAQAQTVLGTPYYISPEMCEGKQYDQKSDIWALGCILYEMTCFQKPFQGSSLPALVNNIMKGQYQPVPEQYSPRLRKLIQQILQREPILRPVAADILTIEIPQIIELLDKNQKTNPSNFDSQSTIGRSSRERSVLYEMKGFQSEISLTPLALPPRIKIKQVAVSNTHFIALTTELSVFTWGGGSRGQLGQGDTPHWQETPTSVPVLADRNVRLVGAGDGFSVFITDSGMLMTCGDGSFGCLGHGDWNNLTKPKLIQKVLDMDVSAMSCGPRHVAVLTSDSMMYTWGQGEGGRLGLGHQTDCCSPTNVQLGERVILRSVQCGADGTMVITAANSLMACGMNTYNKLGLSEWKLFPPRFQALEKSLHLRKVTSITASVAEVSLGASHTAVLTLDGYVITMGRNGEAQLGHSLSMAQSQPFIVKKMADIVVSAVSCGPTYTIAISKENVLFMWGTRYHELTNNLSRSLNSTSFNQTSSTFTSRSIEEVFNNPKELLALYASPQQIANGNTLILGGVYPISSGNLLLVHTTVPLAKKPQEAQTPSLTKRSESDADSLGPIPDWIKAEVAESEAPWGGYSTSSVDWKNS